MLSHCPALLSFYLGYLLLLYFEQINYDDGEKNKNKIKQYKALGDISENVLIIIVKRCWSHAINNSLISSTMTDAKAWSSHEMCRRIGLPDTVLQSSVCPTHLPATHVNVDVDLAASVTSEWQPTVAVSPVRLNQAPSSLSSGSSQPNAAALKHQTVGYLFSWQQTPTTYDDIMRKLFFSEMCC